MATAKLGIWNMALSHLGQGKEVQDEDENSAAAGACRRFYDQVVDEALGDFRWSFNRKFATLALIEADPTDEWAYAYRVPSDCLTVRRILSGIRNDTNATAIPFIIGQDDSGRLLYTDMENAQVEYGVRLDGTSRFPADFARALSFLLAVYIAPRVTAGDPFGLRKDAMSLYENAIGKAMSHDANQGRADQAPDSEFISVRG